MIWQDKGYTVVHIIEIIIGMMTLYVICKMLMRWRKVDTNKKVMTNKWFTIIILFFDVYLLVDKLGYLVTVLLKTIEHHITYTWYDYALLSMDALCTIGLIISTGIFAKSIIKFYNYTPNLKVPDHYTLQIMRRISKSFRWLILLFASKDLALGIIASMMERFESVQYVVYASSYMTITFVFMLILFATIKVFIAMYKESVEKEDK